METQKKQDKKEWKKGYCPKHSRKLERGVCDICGQDIIHSRQGGQGGQGLIEYALLIGLIALVVYMLLSWGFGTPHIANWPTVGDVMRPFERLFNDFLYRASIFTHL